MGTDSHRPLAGKRVVVTRAPEQSRELIRALEELGAVVLLFPVVAFLEPEDTRALDEAIRSRDEFDWLLFTSQNAVRFFAKRARTGGLKLPGEAADMPKIAAVGPATARAAREEGFRVDFIASDHQGRALAREMGALLRGQRALLPRSDRAGEELPNALRGLGAVVTEVIAYRTTVLQSADGNAREQIERGDADVIIFASPSAFHHFMEMVGAEAVSRIAGWVRFAAIGPTTAAAIRAGGVPVEIEPKEATAAALAAAIGDYFERLSSGAKRQ